MVVASHLSHLQKSDSSLVAWLYAQVFYEGYIGVTFFFILSGFILSYSYSDRAEAGRLQYSNFIFTRIARIFPLHLLTLLFALPLVLWGLIKGSTSAFEFAIALPLNAALLQAFIPAKNIYFSLNAPSWSLSVEMFFYALFPALLAIRSRWLAALAIAILLVKYAVSVVGPEWTIHYLVYIFPPSRLADFVVGIVLFRLYRHWPLPTIKWATFAQLLSIAALVAFFCSKEFISQAMRFDTYYILPMAMLVISFSWDQGLFAKAISGRALVFLGEASFALYMVHLLVIRWGEALRLKIFNDTSAGIEAAVVYVLVSVGLSALLFWRFEIKAKDWTLKALQNRQTRSLARKSLRILGQAPPTETP